MCAITVSERFFYLVDRSRLLNALITVKISPAQTVPYQDNENKLSLYQ